MVCRDVPWWEKLTEAERATLRAYRALHPKPKSRIVGELDHTHQATADSDEDVNREGDL